MDRPRKCRSCDRDGASVLAVTVVHRRMSRLWRVVVCRDCWRAFEALLDGACYAVQDSLGVVPTAGANLPLSWLW